METETLTKKELTPSQNKDVKIFIVDDDAMYRQVLEHQLKKYPEYKISSFKSGEDCFKYVRTINPDIVILDYRLNDSNHKAMNGLEILKRLKRINPQISVLMLSGQESFEVAANSVKYGAFDYVVKNESAFVRIQHLINKIIDEVKLQRIAHVQANYSVLLIIAGIVSIATPAILQYFIPDKISWVFLIVFGAYFTLFVIINKINFKNKISVKSVR